MNNENWTLGYNKVAAFITLATETCLVKLLVEGRVTGCEFMHGLRDALNKEKR